MRALTMDEAAEELGVAAPDLRKMVKEHPHYQPMGPRTKVFYPEHIRRLSSILNPPEFATALEVLRQHFAERVNADMLAQFEEFLAREFTGQVYILRCSDRLKIGFTTHWIRRLRVLRTACPYPVTVVVVMAGDRILEQILHTIFEAQRRHGEWFEEAGDLAEFVARMEALGR